jgi:hypothetical protein
VTAGTEPESSVRETLHSDQPIYDKKRSYVIFIDVTFFNKIFVVFRFILIYMYVGICIVVGYFNGFCLFVCLFDGV